MLYDPQNYAGIKGGTKFSEKNLILPQKQQRLTTQQSQQTQHTQQSQQCKSVKYSRNQSTIFSQTKVEDRLLEYERRRKQKILKLQDDNFKQLQNKENQKLDTKISRPLSTLLRKGSLKEIIKSQTQYAKLPCKQYNSPNRPSILETCMENYIKKKQYKQIEL